MYLSKLLYSLPLAAILLLTLPFKSQASQSHSFDAAATQTASPSATLQQEVHADMNFLADDELHGRGSATRDEHIAALFVASQLQSLGLEPGGDNGTFLQKSALPDPLPARTQQRIAKFQDIPRKETWNAVAILRGTTSPNEIILLTAHLDHLGIGPATRVIHWRKESRTPRKDRQHQRSAHNRQTPQASLSFHRDQTLFHIFAAATAHAEFNQCTFLYNFHNVPVEAFAFLDPGRNPAPTDPSLQISSDADPLLRRSS